MQEKRRFVIVGCGQVGFRVASLLLGLGEEVDILTQSIAPDRRSHLEGGGANIQEGDAQDTSLLRSLSLDSAFAVLVLTSHDEINIRVALECKRLAAQTPVIARLFDQNLAEQLEKGIGIDRALAMSVLAAPSFASAAVGTDVVGEFHLGNHSFMLARARVGEHSHLVGKTPAEILDSHRTEMLLRIDPQGQPRIDGTHMAPIVSGEMVKLMGRPDDLVGILPSISLQSQGSHKKRSALKEAYRSIPKILKALIFSVIVLSLLSVAVFQAAMGLAPIDALYFVVTTLTTTGYGDITPKDSGVAVKLYTCLLMVLGSAFVALLYSVITDMIVTARFRELVGTKPVPEEDHVVVVGLGDVGYRVAEELAQSGMDIVIVDSHPDSPYTTVMKSRHPLILGDGREPETLGRANLEKARSVIVMTGNDAVNLSVGLLAKRLAPQVRVVLRIFDPEFATAIRDVLEIDEALSASRLAAPEFVAAAYNQSAVAAFVLHGHLVSLVKSGEGRELQLGPECSLRVHTRPLSHPEVFAKA